MTLTLTPQDLPWEMEDDDEDHENHEDHEDDEDHEDQEDDQDSPHEHSGDESELWNFVPSFLFDRVASQEWESMGLSHHLAESAAIALHAKRPLCVDPQEQVPL